MSRPSAEAVKDASAGLSPAGILPANIMTAKMATERGFDPRSTVAAQIGDAAPPDAALQAGFTTDRSMAGGAAEMRADLDRAANGAGPESTGMPTAGGSDEPDPAKPHLQSVGDLGLGKHAVPALVVDELSHRFGKNLALDRVSFTLRQGGFYALLGVNGAGKTTLFSLITRLYDSTSGRIMVAGYDARRAPGKALARLGVVFQSRALDADLTLAQNLRYHAALHGIGGKAAKARTCELAKLVGLSEKLDARVSTLSGGQQRRAEIARALLHRPQVLLLDEATAGLDLRARGEVMALLRRLIAENGVSVLLATHIFDELIGSDQLVVLHQGRVLADMNAADFAGDEGLETAFLRLTGAAQ